LASFADSQYQIANCLVSFVADSLPKAMSQLNSGDHANLMDTGQLQAPKKHNPLIVRDNINYWLDFNN